MPDTPNNGWIKLMRSQEAHELTRDAAALGLLGIIAMRARWRTGFNIHGLKPGEALMGDYDAVGLSRQVYRTHLANLQKWGFVTTRATNKGTIVTLTGKVVFDINEELDNQQANQTATNGQPTANQRPTTNKEGKKDKKETIPETSSSTTPTLSQPQAVGEGEEEEVYLAKEELWRRVCLIVGRPPEQPRTPGEEEALQDNEDVVLEANMQLLERHAAFEYARKGNRGQRTARTLLTHLVGDVKDAWVWSRSAPAASASVGSPAEILARPQPAASASMVTAGELLAPEALWQRVCQVLRRSLEKPRTEPEQEALQRCSTWLGEADLQLLENSERRKQTYPRHRSETAFNFLTFAEGRVREIKSRGVSPASTSPPAQTASPSQQRPAVNAGAEDRLLAPDELWLRVCRVVLRPAERSRNPKEQLALDHCIDVWESDMRVLESYAAQRGIGFRRSACTLLQCMRTELNAAREWDQRRGGAPLGTSGQSASATNGLNGHQRPTVDEVFAYISPHKWSIEVARAYIDARTRTDPPWHLPATNDRPARPISADWHADIHRFLTNWIEVEKKKAERQDRDMELF